MKKDIVEYCVGIFTDFKNQQHVITACAVSKTPESSDLMVGWVNDDNRLDEDEDIFNSVVRTVSIGFSICSPGDEYDEEVGKQIAFNRANKAIPVLYSTQKGIISSDLVQTLMDKEIEYLKSHPEKIFPGYAKSYKRYAMKVAAKELYDEATQDEQQIITLALSGADIEKCLKIFKCMNEN
jgi:hypothetical protein